MLRRGKVLLVCWGIPASVLAGSYIWLSVEHATPRLWDMIVHESGRHTLRETVLYYSHFLREIPTVVAFVLFLLGASGKIGPGAHTSQEHARGLGWAAIAFAGVLVGVALVRAAADDGWESALLDLAQYRTRDDLMGFGSHWRYHWFSTLWFGAAAGLAPGLMNRLLDSHALGLHRVWMGLAWAYFALLTVVFGLSRDVLFDVRYVGHQAREILTHGPMTLLLGLGLLLAATGRGQHSAARSLSLPRWMTGALWMLAMAIPLYLAVVSLTGDVMEHGQSEQGLAAMVAAHYFEHTLDYLLALLLLGGSLALVNFQVASVGAASSNRRKDRDHADY